jgi:hypothetical protein
LQVLTEIENKRKGNVWNWTLTMKKAA